MTSTEQDEQTETAAPEPSTPALAPERGSEPEPEPELTFTEEVETESIDFDTETIDDSTMAAGETAVTVVGVAGVKTFTYRVTWERDTEVSRELVSE